MQGKTPPVGWSLSIWEFQLDLMGLSLQRALLRPQKPHGPHTRLRCWVPHSLCAGEFTALGVPEPAEVEGTRPGAERHAQLASSLGLLICQRGSSKTATGNIPASENSRPGV